MDCNVFVNNFLFVIMFTSFLNLCLYVTVSQYTSGEMICQHLFLIKKICGQKTICGNMCYN